MKWLLRVTAVLLALDLAAGLFGLFLGMRAGGAGTLGQASYWTPTRIGVSLLALACLGLWCWLAIRALRSPWNAAVPLVVYLVVRLGLTVFLWKDLAEEGVTAVLLLNAFPLGALFVAILALLKPVPEPGAAETP